MNMNPRALVLLAALLPVATVAADVSYNLDDGSGESGLGGFNQTKIWMNSFTSSSGGEFIKTVSISFGAGGADPATYNGQSIGIYIWSDPTNDGNPTDAVLEASMSGVISNFTNTSGGAATVFVDFTFPTSTYIAAGDVFFVGMSNYSTSNVFGPARDTGTSVGLSWIYSWNGDVQAAAAADPSSALGKQNYDSILGGNAMIRAIGSVSAIPEPSTYAVLTGLAALGLCVRRRPARS